MGGNELPLIIVQLTLGVGRAYSSLILEGGSRGLQRGSAREAYMTSDLNLLEWYREYLINLLSMCFSWTYWFHSHGFL